MQPDSKKAIFAAVAANVAITTIKFAAAAATGSSAMLSEGIHSLVDSGDSLLLYVGLKRSGAPPDELHPYGHGKELYFWSLVVAMMIFAAGGGITVYEGIMRSLTPRSIAHVGWTYATLGVAAIFDGVSLTVAFREFTQTLGEQSLWRAVRTSKNPAIFTVIFEDCSDLAGIVLAFLGIWSATHFGLPVLDGVASILIGLLLGTVALLSGRECMSLLIGEGVNREKLREIRKIAERQEGVLEIVGDPLTMYFGPQSMLVNIAAAFDPELPARRVAESIDSMERQMRQRFPEIKRVFIAVDKARRAPAPTRESPGEDRAYVPGGSVSDR